MSASEVIINEQALEAVSKSIKTYVSSYREALVSALRSIGANSSDWNDEDFNSLVSAIGALIPDIDGIENATEQLVKRIDNKIEAIHILHGMKI